MYSAVSAAAGISIIEPTGMSGLWRTPSRASEAAASARRERARRISSGAPTIGSMRRTSPSAATRSTARSCGRNTSGCAKHQRSERRPLCLGLGQGAAVGHCDLDLVGAYPPQHPDPPVLERPRVAYGVAEQLGEHDHDVAALWVLNLGRRQFLRDGATRLADTAQHERKLDRPGGRS